MPARCVISRDRIVIELRARIVGLAQRHRRYGVGMIHLKLRQAGQMVNYKRVERLYWLEQLHIRRRRRKTIPVSDRQPLIRPGRVAKSTRFGLILAGVHALPVSVAFLITLLGGGSDTRPLWMLLLAIDFPASFLLFFLPELFKELSVYLPLFFGILGGIWWFMIGWLIAWIHSRLVTSTPNVRFRFGFLISAVIVLLLLCIQFVWTAPNIAHDGCASVGFPAPFFQGCYGTFSLYWPAMTVAKDALLTDATTDPY